MYTLLILLVVITAVSTFEAKIGDNVTIVCGNDVSNSKIGFVMWYFNDVYIFLKDFSSKYDTDSKHYDVVKHDETNTINLVIYNVTQYDAGTYDCYTGGRLPSLKFSHHLSVILSNSNYTTSIPYKITTKPYTITTPEPTFEIKYNSITFIEVATLLLTFLVSFIVSFVCVYKCTRFIKEITREHSLSSPECEPLIAV
ncbi:putative immunoglobulin-like domain containing protein [Namao virus]|nr:putative immunoglobulin-like domain containing protein [Namao virus]